VQAFIHSINAVFCELGIKLGPKRILDEAKRFGFYSKPPIELPPSEVAPSGLYNFKKGTLYAHPGLVDPGPPGVRAGAHAGDPAPDGAGRSPASQTAATSWVPHLVKPRDERKRAHRGEDPPPGLEARHEAGDRSDDQT